MAVAEIIGAAIGVIMLVIVAYMLVGSVLTTAEVVTNAQKDITLLQGARLGTGISLNRSEISNTTLSVLNFSVRNTGNEIISDFGHTDVYTWDGSSADGYKYYIYDKYKIGTTGNWSITIENDIIHPNQLDPGEKSWVTVNYLDPQPIWFQVTTGNGVNAQTTI